MGKISSSRSRREGKFSRRRWIASTNGQQCKILIGSLLLPFINAWTHSPVFRNIKPSNSYVTSTTLGEMEQLSRIISILFRHGISVQICYNMLKGCLIALLDCKRIPIFSQNTYMLKKYHDYTNMNKEQTLILLCVFTCRNPQLLSWIGKFACFSLRQRQDYCARCLDNNEARPLFIKRTDVLPQDLERPRSRAMGCYNDRIALEFDRHVQFQRGWNFKTESRSFKTSRDNTIRRPSTSLTHWSRVTHICVDNLPNIGSDNGLAPGRRQAIIWTNVGILLF